MHTVVRHAAGTRLPRHRLEPAMETSAYILTELAALYPQSTLRSVCHCDRLRRGVPLKPTLLGEVLWPVPFCTALTHR